MKMEIGGPGGSVVVDNGKVYIDGERCYPHDLIEELDEAWHEMVLYYEPHAVGDIHRLGEISRRVRTIRSILGLA